MQDTNGKRKNEKEEENRERQKGTINRTVFQMETPGVFDAEI